MLADHSDGDALKAAHKESDAAKKQVTEAKAALVKKEAEMMALQEKLSGEAEKAKAALKAAQEEKEVLEKSSKEATDKASTLETQVQGLNHFKAEYESAKALASKAQTEKKEALGRESDVVNTKNDLEKELKELAEHKAAEKKTLDDKLKHAEEERDSALSHVKEMEPHLKEWNDMKAKALSGDGGGDGGSMNEQEEMVLKNSLKVAEKKLTEYEGKLKTMVEAQAKLEAEKTKFEKRYIEYKEKSAAKEEHHVNFNHKFEDLKPDTFEGALKEKYINQVAKKMDIEPADIQLSAKAGSLVLDVTAKHRDPDAADAGAGKMESMSFPSDDFGAPPTMPGGPPKAKMVIDAPTKKSIDGKLAKDQAAFHDHAGQMDIEAKLTDQCIRDRLVVVFFTAGLLPRLFQSVPIPFVLAVHHI